MKGGERKKGRRKKKQMLHWELNPGPFVWKVKALTVVLCCTYNIWQISIVMN